MGSLRGCVCAGRLTPGLRRKHVSGFGDMGENDMQTPERQQCGIPGFAFRIVRRVIGFFLILISTSLIAAQEVDPDEAKEKSVADEHP